MFLLPFDGSSKALTAVFTIASTYRFEKVRETVKPNYFYVSSDQDSLPGIKNVAAAQDICLK